jgi:hypothetical protein
VHSAHKLSIILGIPLLIAMHHAVRVYAAALVQFVATQARAKLTLRTKLFCMLHTFVTASAVYLCSIATAHS